MINRGDFREAARIAEDSLKPVKQLADADSVIDPPPAI